MRGVPRTLFGSNAQQLRGRPAVHINGRMNLDAVYGAAIPLGDTFQHAGFVGLIAMNLADQRDFIQRSNKRHSSAIMNSVRSIGRHSNGILIVLHSSSTMSIVMLSSAPSDHGGVMTFPLRTKSTHDPIASATRPCWFNSTISVSSHDPERLREPPFYRNPITLERLERCGTKDKS